MTALALTVELGDWRGYDPARLGAFLGLVPSEHSSGEQRRQGPITKTGNSHARRLLVEAAWHQRRPLRASVALSGRRAGQSAAVRAEAEAVARRLIAAGGTSSSAASAARSLPSRSLVSLPATAGSWQRWRSLTSHQTRRGGS